MVTGMLPRIRRHGVFNLPAVTLLSTKLWRGPNLQRVEGACRLLWGGMPAGAAPSFSARSQHFAGLLLPRPAPPKLCLHARRGRNNFIDLHVLLRRIHHMAGRVEFLRRLEHGLRAEGGPGVVSGEQGLEFADDPGPHSPLYFSASYAEGPVSMPRCMNLFASHAHDFQNGKGVSSIRSNQGIILKKI